MRGRELPAHFWDYYEGVRAGLKEAIAGMIVPPASGRLLVEVRGGLVTGIKPTWVDDSGPQYGPGLWQVDHSVLLRVVLGKVEKWWQEDASEDLVINFRQGKPLLPLARHPDIRPLPPSAYEDAKEPVAS